MNIHRVEYKNKYICKTCGEPFYSKAGARVHKKFNPNHKIVPLPK